MHIPDGYLSPLTCAALYAAAAPFWYVALRRVKRQLSTRLVPLLSVFAAFSFVLMMFVMPVFVRMFHRLVRMLVRMWLVAARMGMCIMWIIMRLFVSVCDLFVRVRMRMVCHFVELLILVREFQVESDAGRSSIAVFTCVRLLKNCPIWAARAEHEIEFVGL